MHSCGEPLFSEGQHSAKKDNFLAERWLMTNRQWLLSVRTVSWKKEHTFGECKAGLIEVQVFHKEMGTHELEMGDGYCFGWASGYSQRGI